MVHGVLDRQVQRFEFREYGVIGAPSALESGFSMFARVGSFLQASIDGLRCGTFEVATPDPWRITIASVSADGLYAAYFGLSRSRPMMFVVPLRLSGCGSIVLDAAQLDARRTAVEEELRAADPTSRARAAREAGAHAERAA